VKRNSFSWGFSLVFLCASLIVVLALCRTQAVQAASNGSTALTGVENQGKQVEQNTSNLLQNPLDLIHSTGWKLTLPINSAQEIKVGGNPNLATYASEWFHLNTTQDGVVFKARTDGATTSGSGNPRSELREMTGDGKTNATWSSATGVHSMEVELAVNALPIGSKPQVVIGQIHDASDDVTVFRVEGSLTDRSLASIWITDGNTSHGHLLTNAYHLGDKYRVGFSVAGKQIHFTFNGQPVDYVQNKAFNGAYFKAGAYNQSGGNCTKLADGQCDYAEVTIYALQVCHDGNCTGNAASGDTPPTAIPNAPTAMPTPLPTVTPAPSPTATSTLPGQSSSAPTATPTNLPTAAPTSTPTTQPKADQLIYLSSTSDGKINNIAFKDEDVMAYDTTTDQWQLYFDGSDVGLTGADIDAFTLLPDGSLLFSLTTAKKVPGIGKVDDSDIVRFVPTALGSTTDGAFELYFAGAKVGLTENGEDIDALAVLKDGRLIISTTGRYTVGNLAGDGRDLLAFTPRSLGANTAGDWALYLKGSEMGLNDSKMNTSGVWIDESAPDGVHLYWSAIGRYVGDQWQGDANDIYTCLLSPGTPCTLQRFWDGNAHTFGNETIDGLAMTFGYADANLVKAASASEDDGGASDDMESADELAARDENLAVYQLFLPVVTK